MTTKETFPEEDGGYTEVYYRDDNGEPADKAAATQAELVQYDAAGQEVGRTYGTLG